MDITKVAVVSPSTISRSFSENLGIQKETADNLKIIASDIGNIPAQQPGGLKTYCL
jgi:hypothetical protein